jgi:hypothetical protein
VDCEGSSIGYRFFLARNEAFLILSGGPFQSNHATGLSAITGITIYNPLFYGLRIGGFVACSGTVSSDCCGNRKVKVLAGTLGLTSPDLGLYLDYSTSGRHRLPAEKEVIQ